MRILMMGTGPFAVPTFEALLNSDHEVLGLVTRPDRAGPGRRPAPPSPMRAVAESRGLMVLAPESVNAAEFRPRLEALAADLFVVCDYGQILSADTLRLARLGGINLHGSLLPKYRGAAPINWAIWEGETETGVTVIHMTPRLDGGPCLTRRTTPIGPEETASELEPRLSQLGVEPVLEAIAMLRNWDGVSSLGQPQAPALATKAPRLKKSDGEVHWTQPAVRIRRQVRALKPWPGTYSHWLRPNQEPVRLILDAVSPVETKLADEPGRVLHSDDKALWIATGEGVLSLDRVQPAGKRSMDVAEFLRGHRVVVGDRLGAEAT